MFIRQAVGSDFPTIRVLADEHKHELGWINSPTLRGSMARRELFVADEDGVVCGFVRWHARQDGWNTLYELVVSAQHRCRGVGRMLLYAVPCPVRLRCPVDLPANAFYQASGMILEGREPGKKRELNVWVRRVLAVIVRGGNPVVPGICRSSGQAYGVQKETAYAPPFMIDIEWEPFDWPLQASRGVSREQYLRDAEAAWIKYQKRVQELHPVMAMVADYMEPEQKPMLDRQIADLRADGVLRVLVCPKFHGAIRDIPEDCIVAVSLRTRGKLAKGKKNKFAGFMPNWMELVGRKVHLLGGAPALQKKTIAELQGIGATVISVDGNAHLGAAATGSVYADGKWRRKDGEKVTLLPTQVQSSQNITKELNASAAFSQLKLFE